MHKCNGREVRMWDLRPVGPGGRFESVLPPLSRPQMWGPSSGRH